jgi:amidase
MNLREYSGYDGVGLADLIRKKEVTAGEVAESMLAGAQKINPSINAIIETYDDRVQQADQLRLPDKPLAGIPIFLKDLGAGEAGKPQEMGSRLAKGHMAATDAYLTTRFKEAGALILGRTTTPELGFAATTESILTGATRNPWDLNLIAGGSSGGVVGLKSSRGRVTCGPDTDERLFGLVQEFNDSTDSILS